MLGHSYEGDKLLVADNVALFFLFLFVVFSVLLLSMSGLSNLFPADVLPCITIQLYSVKYCEIKEVFS